VDAVDRVAGMDVIAAMQGLGWIIRVITPDDGEGVCITDKLGIHTYTRGD
jgi:hypothetical protein